MKTALLVVTHILVFFPIWIIAMCFTRTALEDQLEVTTDPECSGARTSMFTHVVQAVLSPSCFLGASQGASHQS